MLFVLMSSSSVSWWPWRQQRWVAMLRRRTRTSWTLSLNASMWRSYVRLTSSELTSTQGYLIPIRTAISQRLDQDISIFRRLLEPGSHTAVTEIPRTVQQMKNEVTGSQTELSRSRLALAQEIQQLHALYRQVMETSIRILEQTIHGSVARGTKAKADYLATVAEGMSKKLGVQHAQLMQQVYSPEMQEALRGRVEAMQSESVALRRKVREAEARREEYRAARGMQGMVKEYAEILRESQRVEEEISRLERR